MSFFDQYTSSEVIKAYTSLLQTTEPAFAILLAKINLDLSSVSFDSLVVAIQQWCLTAEPLNGVASVEENLENQLDTIVVDSDDTEELLIRNFMDRLLTIRSWDSYSK